MSNDFYNSTSVPAARATLASSVMRGAFALIEAGFSKLPTMTANGRKIWRTNAAGTAAEALNAQDIGFFVLAEQYGAAGTGLVVDTPELQDALDAAEAAGGGVVWLKSGATYKIDESLIIADRCGLMSDGTAKLIGYAADFSNTSLAAGDRYGTDAIFVNMSGLTTAPYTQAVAPFVIGVQMEYVTDSTELVCGAIACRNVLNAVIEDCEIFGFPVGCGVRGATMDGGRIVNNIIRDFADDHDWSAQAPSFPQLTGIEIDNDRVNSVSSDGVLIHGNKVTSLVLGATAVAAHGDQTDGINIVYWSSCCHRITDNYISDVGEGIDHFGGSSVIAGNVVKNAGIFGIKLVNGARLNVVSGNTVENFGLGGITIAGTSVAGAAADSTIPHTELNTITGNVVNEGNYNGLYTASANACMYIIDNGGGKLPKNNIATGNTFREGPAGKNCWYDSSTGTGNIGEGNSLITGAANQRRVNVVSGAGSCRLVGTATYETNLV